MTSSIPPVGGQYRRQQDPDAAPAPRPGQRQGQPPKQTDRTTIGLLLVAAFIAVAGIGFAIGHVTAQSTTSNPTNALGGRGLGGFPGGGRNFPSLAPGQTFDTSQFGGGRGGGLAGVAGGISGTVQAVSGSSITIQEANGTSVTIDLSGNTTYHSAAAASASDVKVGTSVTVQIDTSALASESPAPNATGVLGGRTFTAKDVLITNP